MSMTKPEVLRALADGKEVEINHKDKSEVGWVSLQNYGLLSPAYFDLFEWRLKPTSRMVPLDSGDTIVGMAMLSPSGAKWAVVNQTEHHVGLVYVTSDLSVKGHQISYEELQNGWQISRDGGKTWTRCEKPAE